MIYFQVWDGITEKYNASQIGGKKTKKQLKNKFIKTKHLKKKESSKSLFTPKKDNHQDVSEDSTFAATETFELTSVESEYPLRNIQKNLKSPKGAKISLLRLIISELIFEALFLNLSNVNIYPTVR